MIEPLRRYADFSGRSRRQEFWMFFLFQTLVVMGIFALYLPLAAVGMDARGGSSAPVLVAVPIILYIMFVLAMLVPNAAVIVRRCHDQNIPGVVGGLLYVGMWFVSPLGLLLLIFMCIDGKAETNEHGPDPKGRGTYDIFA